MNSFTCDIRTPRVAFGAGPLAKLPDEVDRLRLSRVLVLSSPGQRALAERVAALLGGRVVGVFAGAVMHVPREVVVQACEAVRAAGADGTVAVGGSSTTGQAATATMPGSSSRIAMRCMQSGAVARRSPAASAGELGVDVVRPQPD